MTSTEPTRRPAALAAVGARTVSLSDPALMVFVRQAEVAPAARLLPVTVSGDALEFTERVAFAFGSVQVEGMARFRGGDQTSLTSNFRRLDAELLGPMIPQDASSYAFGAEFRHNLGFLYDSRRTVEILLTVDAEAPPRTLADSLGLASLSAFMCRLAAVNAKAPILFLQTPVAPHNDPHERYRLDGAGERLRSGQRFALRMAVGVDDGDVQARLKLLNMLRLEAERSGFGLQVADRRQGRHRGEWWTICSPDRKRLATWRDQVRASLDGSMFSSDLDVKAVRVLSIVGPARTGTSYAILSQIANSSVGVLGVSISALHETAFINLILPDTSDAGGDQPAAGPNTGTAVQMMALAEGQCSVPGRDFDVGEQGDQALLSGYRGVLSSQFVFTLGDAEDGVALWAAWDFPRSVTNEDVVARIMKELYATRKVALCGLGYRRERSSSDWVRGRAKFDITLKNKSSPAFMAEVLEAIGKLAEERVSLRLGLREGYGLRIEWRERRLGSWQSSPL